MRRFLAIYTCAENSKNQQEWIKFDRQTQDDRMQKGMLAREQWAAKYKNQIVFDGGSLGKTTKLIDIRGIHDTPSLIGAFLIVHANSHAEAAKIFLNHPHFSIFPGDGVEVLECLEDTGANLSK